MSDPSDLNTLDQQIAELQKQRDVILKAQRAEVIKELREKARAYGIAAHEIFGDEPAAKTKERAPRRSAAEKLLAKLVEAREAFGKGIKVWRSGDKIYIDSLKGTRPAWESNSTLVTSAQQLG